MNPQKSSKQGNLISFMKTEMNASSSTKTIIKIACGNERKQRFDSKTKRFTTAKQAEEIFELHARFVDSGVIY